MGKYFGTDGVRGRYGDDLTVDLAASLGHAAALVLARGHPRPRVLIGRDTRASGTPLEQALISGIARAGGEALLAGVIPTPAVAHLTHVYDCQAGAVISASHNPAQDNGIKFFGSDGMKLPDAVEDDIEAAMNGGGGEVNCSGMETIADAEETYLSFLLNGEPSLKGLRALVDGANR